MRIVVTGLVATYPMGGVAWDYLTYVDGFHRLGCDVLYLEDTGQWMYDPVRQTFTEDVSVNVRYLSEGLRLLEVPHDAFAVRAPDGTYYGANGQAVERFTTVMSWKTDVTPPMIDGVRYGGKDLEFARFLELPRRARVPLEMAIAGAAPVDRLREHGWHVVSAPERSATMQSYRTYLAGSRGEWSISKNIYVALRTGWFSCRSAMYLALGKPVVVQDTGWSRHYPTGEGLLAFETLEQAAAALEAVDGDYGHHCDAARAIAEREFAAEKVLSRLLTDCGFG